MLTALSLIRLVGESSECRKETADHWPCGSSTGGAINVSGCRGRGRAGRKERYWLTGSGVGAGDCPRTARSKASAPSTWDLWVVSGVLIVSASKRQAWSNKS